MKKRFLVALFAVCMAVSLCACGNTGNTGSSEDTNKQNTQQNSEADKNEEDTQERPTYTIKVVDESNNPVEGAVVQLCKESCSPMVTDANGVAVFTVKEYSDEYKATIATYPDGTQYEGEYVYFEDGIVEITLVMKAQQ